VHYDHLRRSALYGTALWVIVISQALAQQGDHTYTSESITTGAGVYALQCQLCHGPGGGRVQGVNLSRGQFKSAVTDDDLRRTISQGAAQGQMPAFNLTDAELDGVVAFIRVGFDPDSATVRIGNAAAGADLFDGKGGCRACHRVHGVGPRTAPDLSDIGLWRSPAFLQRSLLEPETAVLPINRPIRIVTSTEEVVTGRRLNEDTYTVQVIDSEERLRSFVKADLTSYTISKDATHEPTTLTEQEVADLVAYMLELRGTQ
jgi:putative heme-binding domain-containing protein